MSSACKGSFNSFFPNLYTFNFISCLFALARCCMMLNRSHDKRRTCPKQNDNSNTLLLYLIFEDHIR